MTKFAGLLAALSLPLSLAAQDYLEPTYRLNGRETVKAFEAAVEALKASNLTLHADGERDPIGLATLVAPGVAVAKASDIEEVKKLSAKDHRRREKPAALLRTDKESDLAVLKVDWPEGKPVTWAEAEPGLGEWLVASTPRIRMARVGLSAAKARAITTRGASLGVMLRALKPEDEDEDGKEGGDEEGGDGAAAQGVLVEKVIPGGAADEAGLKDGDLILEVEGEAVTKLEDVSGRLQEREPGEVLKLTIRRTHKEGGEEESGDEEEEEATDESGQPGQGEGGEDPGEEAAEKFEVEVTLDSPSDILDRMNRNQQMSGSTSRRKDPFPRVLQTDIPLPPEAMGGALVNLSGEAVGVLIARVDRVTTFALPAGLVQAVVEERKWTPPEDENCVLLRPDPVHFEGEPPGLFVGEEQAHLPDVRAVEGRAVEEAPAPAGDHVGHGHAHLCPLADGGGELRAVADARPAEGGARAQAELVGAAVAAHPHGDRLEPVQVARRAVRAH